MYQSVHSSLQAVNPLIKLVRQREDLYFELLAFVNKYIDSSSNDLDSLTIFNKFIATAHHKHSQLRQTQNDFLTVFKVEGRDFDYPTDDPVSKEMLRLSSRLIQILEASMGRVNKSIFDECGRAGKQFGRFKIILNKILKREPFIVRDYAEYIISYLNGKYQKQINKVKRYVERVGQGEDIFFKQLYYKQSSDQQSSPDSKKSKIEDKTVKKFEFKAISQEDQKKPQSLKKTVRPLMKRKQRTLSIKNKAKEQEINQLQERPNKDQTAAKLFKFYSLLQLNKKEFFEDYVYEQIEESKHKQELMNKLIERNKTINTQINNFLKKSSNYIPKQIHCHNKNSGQEGGDVSSNSRSSLRISFVISKRKSSFQLESSMICDKINQASENRQQLQKTVKNLNPRRRSSYSNQRPQQKSKKLFVVKAPMVFQDQMIPQAQITQTQWLKAPLTNKLKQRKNQHIRLKRKNNPSPMENTFLQESFRYPI